MGPEGLALTLCVAALTALSCYLALGGPLHLRRESLGMTRISRLADLALDLPVVRRAREAEARSQRREACLSELPVLLDIVTLGLSAGLSFDSSLELYCEQYKNALSEAFGEAMLSWRIGARTREDALARLADELGIGALRRFASVVAEALSFGAPLAGALERQAHAVREEQRSRVEEQIEKVPVKMLVPLGTLIVPAMFLAILGPLLGSALVVG
ncbi:type II secretion system F family protein [Thermophilibacter sp. ET337]|uniref:type II secretion system F family protein n=1 Tax=Thermophilibacter sp. ET337 TaxID=2973084 RepID=UPI0021ABEC84|nr:type II secretion system F family protein [Thermophilibacter sp. ET337]MCR8907738.1 type II secretion system F family protein [Thermophilibacter sp. ET337]